MFCDFSGERGIDELEYYGKGSDVCKELGICDQCLFFLEGTAFDSVTFLLEYCLGQHADMAEEGDTCVSDCLDLLCDCEAAFGLDCLGACGDQPFRIGDSGFGGVITAGREVSGKETLGHGACCCPGVMFHVGHGYGCGIGVSEDNHSERIADEDYVNAGFGQELCSWKIVCCERRDAFAAFHLADGFGRDFGHLNRNTIARCGLAKQAEI